MADKSLISWTDATWNPIRARNRKTGKLGWHCEHVTEACRFCYAERQNARPGDSGGTGLEYKPGHRHDVDIFLDEKVLLKPLSWKRGRKIFVCSMTDAAGGFVPDEWLDKIVAVAILAPQHTFQFLTKRPERMRAYMESRAHQDAYGSLTRAILDIAKERGISFDGVFQKWPIPNVWIGTSLCDQADADKFVPELLATPAVVRFVSCGPLLGPIDLVRIKRSPDDMDKAMPGFENVEAFFTDAMMGANWISMKNGDPSWTEAPDTRPRLHWVIAEGESGPAARPTKGEWMRDLLAQCQYGFVPFHLKHWGKWIDAELVPSAFDKKRSVEMRVWDDGTVAMRVGEKVSGRCLDGVEHDGFPEPYPEEART